MEVHQFHPQVAYGDAASNQVLSLQRLLSGMGYESKIFCEQQPFLFEGRTYPIAQYASHSAPDNVLLLHFTVDYSHEVMSWLEELPDRKVLVYHNITPSHYFARVNEPLAESARKGRRQLDELRKVTEAGWGDSMFNCRELAEHGWTRLSVLPIVFDPDRYAVRPDQGVMHRYRDGGPNILFVGRIAPNKCFEDLILTFFYLKQSVCRDARLLLVGAHAGMEPYIGFLERLVDELGLSDVVFTGHVTNAELIAYYRSADLYLSMSEHEGFGVPLVESMYFGLPIVAYAAAAIPETLSNCGVLVRKKDHAAIAELLGLLTEDEDLRGRIIEGQRQRLQHFLPHRVRAQLASLLNDLMGSSGDPPDRRIP